MPSDEPTATRSTCVVSTKHLSIYPSIQLSIYLRLHLVCLQQQQRGATHVLDARHAPQLGPVALGAALVVLHQRRRAAAANAAATATTGVAATTTSVAAAAAISTATAAAAAAAAHRPRVRAQAHSPLFVLVLPRRCATVRSVGILRGSGSGVRVRVRVRVLGFGFGC